MSAGRSGGLAAAALRPLSRADIASLRLDHARRAWIERVRIVAVAGVASSTFCLSVAHAQMVDSTAAREVGFSPERLERLHAMLEAEVTAGHLGSGVGLVARDGLIVYLGAVGEAAPGVPMFTDAIVRLASVGKGFTAVAALILYERGELDLDDRIADYIPTFSKARVAVTDADGATKFIAPERPLTIRHLLTHTGGLDLSSEAFERAWMATEAKTTTRDLAERIARLPMPAHPGTAFEYGSYGSSYEVLAAVIEQVSGRTLEEFFDENLFRPLGMTDSHFWVPESKLERLATIYRTRNGQLTVERPRGEETPRTTFMSGGGGVRSTVRDMYRFGQMLLNGGELDGVRILSPKTVSLMTTDHVAELQPWGQTEYGWGFGAAVRNRVRDDGIGSAGTFGWNGGSGAIYWVDPLEGIVAVLVTPVGPPPRWDIFDKFERLMYAAIVESRAFEMRAPPPMVSIAGRDTIKPRRQTGTSRVPGI
jgi:CubicO group peptidase (beta-lactamase class C family)